MFSQLQRFLVQSLIFIFTLTLYACSGGGGGSGSNSGNSQDTSPPQIRTVSPFNNASNVAVDSALSATFSKPIESASIGSNNFTLIGPSGAVACTINVTGATATFTPTSNLDYGRSYTATISGGVRDSAGNTMSDSYSWSFITVAGPDKTAPTVINAFPANNATAVPISVSVSATFSEPMNTATITGSSFMLSGPSGAVAGNLNYSGNTITFTPSTALGYGSSYTATITTAIQDLAGNPIASNYVWVFTTTSAPLDSTPPIVSLTSPINNAINVDPSSKVTATFSEVMKVGTLTTNSFSFTGPGGKVAGNVDYSGGLTASFSPLIALDTNTSYTATITTAVQDASGNALASNYAWSFTTRHWTRVFGSFRDDWAKGVATDTSGNIYVAGITQGDLDGNTNPSGLNDFFVVKFDSAGVKQWTRQLGSTGSEEANSVATDANGNVYVVGSTNGGLDGYTVVGADDLFIVKYNSAGVKQWSRELGSGQYEYTSARGVATDTYGNVYVVGTTNGGLDGNTNNGGYDCFIVKYDSTGAKLWTRQFGSVDGDYAEAVATDASGNVYVAGETENALDGNTYAGNSDLFVVKFDGQGVKKWTRELGSAGMEGANAVATDASGNVYVTGSTFGDLDGNTRAGNSDLFVVKYDSAGIKQWTRELGSSGFDPAFSIATDASSNVYVVGWTDGAIDGNSNVGGNDYYIVKFNSAGVKQWTRQFGTIFGDSASGVAVDVSGNIYVVGSTNLGLDSNYNTGDSDIFIAKYDSEGNRR